MEKQRVTRARSKQSATGASVVERRTVKRRTADESVIAAVKQKASITTIASVRQAVKSVKVAVTQGPGISGLVPSDQSVILVDQPMGWPANVPWKPRRFFGPFWGGSDLHQIEIYVSGPSFAEWYFNDYFVNHPDFAPYQPFFPDGNLPTLKTPAENMVPGAIPGVDGAGQFVCSLDRIAYSSRYGGTVELTFRARNDVGLEVRRGDFVWDLKNVEIRVYVAPVAYGLQNPSWAYNRGDVTCEIFSSEQTCYSVPIVGTYSTPGTPFQALDDVHQWELTQAFGLLCQEWAKDIAQHARRFVGGYLHTLFPELLGLDRIVEGINISDDFIDLHSRQGIPAASVRFQARNVISYGADLVTEPEFRLTLDSMHVYNGGIVRGPVETCRVENEGDTPRIYAGQWTLDEVSNLGSIVLRVSGVELDWPDADDVFRTYEMEIELDHAELLAAHNAREYGLIQELSGPASSEFLNSNWHIFFDMCVTVALGLR